MQQTSTAPANGTIMSNAQSSSASDSPKSVNLDHHESISYFADQKTSTPITLLNEICSRNGISAEYQLISTEGSVHEPTFKYVVTVANITATASGESKKKAKHAAAKEAIERLRREQNLKLAEINFDNLIASNPEPSAKPVASPNEPNPVGKLQEFCMKLRVNPPNYETCQEKGLAHDRIFILSCSIAYLDLVTMGEGRSKKLAKRQAAENMLNELDKRAIYDKKDNKSSGDHGSSLHIDADDNAHFIKARSLVTNLASRVEENAKDLVKDLDVIQVESPESETIYNTFSQLIQQANLRDEFLFLTESVCRLNLVDGDDNIILTSMGRGNKKNLAMCAAVIDMYKQMMVIKMPLIETENDQLLQEEDVESHRQILEALQSL